MEWQTPAIDLDSFIKNAGNRVFAQWLGQASTPEVF